MPRKLCYRQWLVNYGFDPRYEGPAGEMVVYQAGDPNQEEVEAGGNPSDGSSDGVVSQDTIMVRRALGRLLADERDLVERFYFMGQGYPEIAEATQSSVSRIERRHRLVLRKLRRLLEPWVKNGDASGLEQSCRICRSAERAAIEQIILSRAKEESYRRIMRILRTRFGIRLNNPNLVIRHHNCHMTGRTI